MDTPIPVEAPSERPASPPAPAEPQAAEQPLFTSFCYAPNLVFVQRNRSYGAYWMRRAYQKRLSVALLIASVGFCAGVASPIIYKRVAGRIQADELSSRPVELTRLEAPPLDPKQPPPPELPPPPPPPKVATVRFVPPEVAHDEEVADEEIPPPQEELKEIQASSITQEGDPNVDPDEIIVEDPVSEVAQVIGVVEERQEAEVFVVVEQMPEIIGGPAEVYKHLQYPEIALKAGIEGLVVVQIVVEPDGSPSNATVMRSAGSVLDQPAMNAVMKLRFFPGKQRGMPVRVKVALPIRFRLKDAEV